MIDSQNNFIDWAAVDDRVANAAFNAFLISNSTIPNAPALTKAHRAAAAACHIAIGDKKGPDGEPLPAHEIIYARLWNDARRAHEFRNVLSGDQLSRGGALVGEGFLPALELALDGNSCVRREATVVRAPGDPVRQPAVDDPGEALVLPDEAAQTASLPSFRSIVWHLKTFFAPIPTSEEWWQDTPDPATKLGQLAGEMIAKRQNRWYTQSNGGLVATALARSSISSNAISSDDLENLIADTSEDAIEGAKFMLSPSAWKYLRQLKDGQGAKLLKEGKIADFGFCINPHLGTTSDGTGTTSILFGDFRKGFKIVDSDVVDFQAYTETLMSLNQVLWVGRQRSDGAVMNRGGRPYIVKLVMS